jgi:hypothetical protein
MWVSRTLLQAIEALLREARLLLGKVAAAKCRPVTKLRLETGLPEQDLGSAMPLRFGSRKYIWGLLRTR